MPRKPRVEFAGAVYHVMCRGDRREPIFLNDEDRRLFLETLVEARERTGWLIHAYVLMVNHYHLLLETPEPNLVAGMRWLQGTYTVRFNHRHDMSGHLFQGRYKALPVSPEEEGYFVQVSSYIHLNPVRANLVHSRAASLSVYPWSSYPDYLKPPRHRREWIAVSRVLGDLGLADDRAGRQAYASHLERLREEWGKRAGREGLESEWNEIRRGWYLGSDTFRDKIRDLAGGVMTGKQRASYTGEAQAAHDEQAARNLLDAGMQALELEAKDLAVLAKSDPRKQVLAWWVRRQTAVSNIWICGQLNMGHPGNLSRQIKCVEREPTPTMGRLKKRILAIHDNEIRGLTPCRS